MRLSLTLILIFGLFTAQAQECNLALRGLVVDKASRVPLSFTTLRLDEDKTKGAISDVHGRFVIPNLCPGEYHVEISFIGYETAHEYVNLNESMDVVFDLGEYDELLNEIVVHGEKDEKSTEAHHVIDQQKIRSEGNKNLADVLESVSGVSVLKTGSGISKPIIHGLYGNRVTIMNNGIVQAGQQWGNDHAPEIDPFVADHISVVKGAGALEYGSSAVGGVIMVDPYKISPDPHLHGKATYVFQTNGLGHTANLQVERADQWASWRLSGTLKLIGDSKTPDYFLSNTGRKEGDFAAQLEKTINKNWFITAYYSMFNTDIGILRGSHISNLTDLEEAVGRDEPFFTKETFSYSIEPPHQRVNHHLAKFELQHLISENKLLSFRYGGQLDNRREFDVRRGGRSEDPALSLSLQSHTVDVNYAVDYNPNSNYKLGTQVNYSDNTNNPETGILPLIPDYRSVTLSGFGIWQYSNTKWLYETAFRYDYKDLEVVAISRTVPREIQRHYHNFHNFGANAGIKRSWEEKAKLSFNLSYAQRAPEVNELYSYGLHQGVSGIEEGSPDLKAERSSKAILSLDWNISDKLYFQGLGYYQHINNYIYLEPQDSFRLTIRGAFPVFVYKQTNGLIYGTDLTLAYNSKKSFSANIVYAIVRGKDVTNDQPLINIPADNVSFHLNFTPKNGKFWLDNKLGFSAKYTFEQTRYLEGQDFLPPPDDYFLLSLHAGSGFEIKGTHVDLGLRVENLLNSKYQDYLNRLRYFSDETGVNMSLSVNVSF